MARAMAMGMATAMAATINIDNAVRAAATGETFA